MKIAVKPDVAACIAAGIESTNSVDVDLSTLSQDDRAAIARHIKADGAFSMPDCSPILPTTAGLVTAAHKADELIAQVEATKMAYRLKEETEAANRQAAADAAFAARKVKVSKYAGSHRGRPYHNDHVQPDMPSIHGTTYGFGKPNEPALDAWLAECRTVTQANQAGAKAALEEQIMGEVAKRAESLEWVPPHNPRHDPLTLISDTGEKVLLRSSDTVGKLICTLTWLPQTPDKISAVYHPADIEVGCTVTTYTISDGVLKIPSAEWAAIVADPSAVKPIYDFLKHVPGGFDASKVEIGSILVYGWKTRKGKERRDRLAIGLNNTSVRVLQCGDYQEARKMRKLASKE